MGNTGTMVEIVYGGIGEDLAAVVDLLLMAPDSNSVIWNTVQNVFHITLPTGLMAAALFCLITLIEKALTFQMLSIEQILKMLLFFVIGKACLENSFEILGWLYQAVAALIGDLGTIPNGGVSETDLNALTAVINSMGFWDKILFDIKLLPSYFFMAILRLLIKVIAWGRLIEIYVYMAVAPLPLCTLVSQTHAGIAKRFLQGYLGVCLQGLIMLFSIMLYTALEVELAVSVDGNTMLNGGLDFMLSSIILLMVLVKSGSWSKTIVGLI